MIQHDDIKELLRGVPIARYVRWLILSDKLVECDMQIRCLDRGSLDPLVGDIRNLLRRRGAMTLDQLTKEVGAKGENGQRVVAEVLHALQKCNEVLVNQTPLTFEANEASRIEDRYVQERLLERKFFFVPRARRLLTRPVGVLWREVRSLRKKEGLRNWIPPEGKSLYTGKSLIEHLELACREYYKLNDFRVPNGELEEYRLEELQRSQLLSIKLRFVDCSVLPQRTTTNLWHLHRCYVYCSNRFGLGPWGVYVHRYPAGAFDNTYSDYLTALLKSDRPGFRELWNRSSPLPS